MPEFKKPPNWSKLGFNEKLRIYGMQLGKDYSIFADKLLVKDYIKKLNLPDLHIPKTIKILDPSEDLNLDTLPKNCIIKSNCGSGDIIIIKNRKIELMKGRNKNLNNYKEWKNIVLKPLEWRPIVEPHYKYIKPNIFVEEYLGDNIKDYKLFCIKGKFIFCQIDSDRFKGHCRNLYDKNYNLLKFCKGKKACQYKIDKPRNYMKMIKISKNISKIFDFCRIDLYQINNKVYFGEITFVPGAAELSDSIRPRKYDMLVGSVWL
tara:strand:+ start:995 stop:1780 length:786 start_codon:yes stop_codon:yes gene_type:complete